MEGAVGGIQVAHAEVGVRRVPLHNRPCGGSPGVSGARSATHRAEAAHGGRGYGVDMARGGGAAPAWHTTARRRHGAASARRGAGGRECSERARIWQRRASCRGEAGAPKPDSGRPVWRGRRPSRRLVESSRGRRAGPVYVRFSPWDIKMLVVVMRAAGLTP